MMKRVILVASVLIALGSSVSVSAKERRPQPPGHKPPQEAIKACEGKTEGDVASFVAPHGEQVEGSCRKMGDTLALVPKNHQREKPVDDN